MHRRKKMYVKKFVTAVLILLIASSVMPLPLLATASWTVMVYLDGDNDLESAAIDDVNEMEVAGSTDDVNVVVQFDRCDSYDTSNGDWKTCKRYYITKDTNGYDSTIVSTLISDLGEKNMGDPATLQDFVTWAQTEYPADHYLLILWDHGSGWKTPKSEPVKTICVDYTDFDSLTNIELKTALDATTSSGSYPLDIVGFDACFMGMIEIDYDILPHAHYRVGSEEYEPSDGWDYSALLNYLTQNPYAVPADVASKIVAGYMAFYGVGGTETQSATYLNPTTTVVNALNTFALHLAGAMAYKSDIQRARTDVQSFFDPDYIDLYHFAELISAYVPDRGIQSDANALMNAIKNAVIAEGHGGMNPNSYGISIYFPASSTNYLSNYETDVDLTEDTFWDEFLNQYYSTSYALDAVMTATPDTVSSDQFVTVSMEVTNMSTNTIASVTPSSLTVSSKGTAFAVLSSGPLPLTADLVAGDSVIFMWVYQVFSGASGGILTFSGNAYGTDSSSGAQVFSPLVSSNDVRVLSSNVISNESALDSNEQVQPLANHRIQAVGRVLESLRQEFAALESEGKDITPCEELLELVEEYLQKAQENYEKGNYIAANYWALQAAAALEEAEECLENL
jgi:hypothetical protein